MARKNEGCTLASGYFDGYKKDMANVLEIPENAAGWEKAVYFLWRTWVLRPVAIALLWLVLRLTVFAANRLTAVFNRRVRNCVPGRLREEYGDENKAHGEIMLGVTITERLARILLAANVLQSRALAKRAVHAARKLLHATRNYQRAFPFEDTEKTRTAFREHESGQLMSLGAFSDGLRGV